MLDLWSKKLLSGGGDTFVDWISPKLTTNGTLGGAGYAAYSNNSSQGSRAWAQFAPYTGQYLQLTLSPGQYVTFYSEKPVLVEQIFMSGWKQYGSAKAFSGAIQGSMDNNKWDTLWTSTTPWTSTASYDPWVNGFEGVAANYGKVLIINAKTPYKYIRFINTHGSYTSEPYQGTCIKGKIQK